MAPDDAAEEDETTVDVVEGTVEVRLVVDVAPPCEDKATYPAAPATITTPAPIAIAAPLLMAPRREILSSRERALVLFST